MSASLLGYPTAFWWLWSGQLFARVGMLAPAFLVLFLEQQRGLDSSATAAMIGLFGAGLVFAGLIGGSIADGIGHRTAILGAQPLAMATAVLMITVDQIAVLALLCFAAGFLTTIDRPAGAAIIAQIVGKQEFSKAYGLYLMGFNVGMTASPILAGLLLEYLPTGIFWIWFSTSLVFLLCALRLPPDRRLTLSVHPRTGFLRGIAAPYRDRRVLGFLVLCFVVALVYLQQASALPLHMASEGVSPAMIGVVFAVNAVLSIGLLPFAPRLAERWPSGMPLTVAATLIAIGFGANAFAGGVGGFLVALVIWTLGEVLWAPMSAKYLADRAPDGQLSSYQSSFFVSWNSALMIGGPIGIQAAREYGFGTVWIGAGALGLAAAVGFVVLARSGRDAHEPETAQRGNVPDTGGPS